MPVQRGLWRRQHPAVTQGGGGGCQRLAAQSPPRLVHGIRVGDRHRHMHGEVLLRQCCSSIRRVQVHSGALPRLRAASQAACLQEGH
ncbi:hypothetical protein EYF80_061755 [Liparis tanakae]|uniref:Uncharacterized protein n=1 Tax=Liparis tanakae TaxID=230148 RepID=A0A4Z2EGP2_9TELE|nr:hypothetical protein EYF80_061755 [Liparis tanakae]